MTKLWDLAVKTGEYLKDGETRNRYENIGAMWEGRGDTPFITLKATFNPAAIVRKEGSDSIMVSCFAPKENRRSGDGGGYRGGNFVPASQPEPYAGPKEDFDFRSGPAGNETSDVPF